MPQVVLPREVGSYGYWTDVRREPAPPAKDHLGSIRAVVDPDAPLTETGTETDKVVETRDYYPYGLRMPGRSVTPGTETAEDYTGHELDAEVNSPAVLTGMHYAGAPQGYFLASLRARATT